MSVNANVQSQIRRRLSLDGWAVAAASLAIILIVIGVVPRVPW